MSDSTAMKYVRASVLYDGTSNAARKNVFLCFDGKRIGGISTKEPKGELIADGIVTPAFIDGHSHIGLARSGEPSSEEEGNERMDPMLPLVNVLDSAMNLTFRQFSCLSSTL